MIRPLAAALATVGEPVASSLIVKATVVTAAAMGAGWLTRRRPAAVRHLIFVATFAVLALLPLAATILPAISVRVVVTPATAGTAGATPLHPIVDGTTLVARAAASPVTGSRSRPALSLAALLSAVWLTGVLSCLASVVLGLWQIRRVRRDGLPWDDAQELADDVARRAGCFRTVDVVVSEVVSGPMTCGVVRPAIVFPVDARRWPHADIRRALIHELEHVRRGDWLTLCAARAVCAAYWFHPFVWMARRQMSVNAERACDDAVLRESHAVGYADQLVTLAERVSAPTRRPLVAMADRGELATRVHAVLNPHQQRGPAGMRARIGVAIAAVGVLVLLAPLRASAVRQTPDGNRERTVAAAARSRFEVASIKPSFSGTIMNVRPLPGRLVADATLQVLMQYAYGVQPFQLLGGPGWLTSDRYAIEGKADAAVNRDQLFLMLKALVEDRFQLETHRETRELPAFTLVAARGGLKLPAPKEGGCVESLADAAVEWAGGRMAVPGELPPAKSRCGSATATIDVSAHIRGGKIAMPEFVRMLSLVLGRPVVDQTGFAPLFDLQLDFVPDDTTPAMPPPPPGSGITGPSIATALQQQLGLRLESTKSPVDVIVVDHAERPAAN